MRLIDADSLTDKLEAAMNVAEFNAEYGIQSGIDRAIQSVRKEPTVDTRRKGYWKDYYKCSRCGFIPNCYVQDFNYCPKCGALMKGSNL